MRWIFLLSLAWASDPSLEVQPLTLEQLETLGRQGAWSEVVFHLKEVPAADRSGRWETLVEQASLGHLETMSAGAPSEADSVAQSLVDEFPSLRRSKKFMEKRTEATLSALSLCYDNPFIETECGGRLLDFVRDQSSNTPLVRRAAGIAVQKNAPDAALPFLKLALEKGSRDKICRDEFWQKAVVAGLRSTEAEPRKQAKELASEPCWAALKTKLAAETDRLPSSELCSIFREKKSLTGARAKKCPPLEPSQK